VIATLLTSVLSLAPAHSAAKPEIDVWAVDRARILRIADAALKQQPVTVTAASSPRSAGGLHDFFSEADYWWPDPANPGGPYIQRDGQSNPDNFDEHRKAMRRLSVQVPALVAAWKLTGQPRYAGHAARHLRAWFVDEATRMNPHLRYAQAISGRVTGRGIGIIDTLHLVEVARAAEVLADARVFDTATQAGVRSWFGDYLRWMTTDKNGIEEREAKNNHGSCWVLQVAAFARLTGNHELLAYCRNRFKTVLIPNQMAVDGSFPEELRRTKPYAYSLFNLEALAGIAQLLSTPQPRRREADPPKERRRIHFAAADDLWAFTLPDGRGLRCGMDFMVPFIRDKKSWPKPPDVMYHHEWPMRQASLLFAGLAYAEPSYVERWRKLPADSNVDEVIRNFFIRQPALWLDPGDRSPTAPESPPRTEWGAPEVEVTQAGDEWTIAGPRQRVVLDVRDLSFRVQAGAAEWRMEPSAAGDLRVRVGGKTVPLRLADATRKAAVRYDTGFKTGVKLVLSGWRAEGSPVDLALFLTLALEGAEEELAFDVAAEEKGATVRQLDWPGALDAAAVDYTLLPNVRGNLIPRGWPQQFDPIRPPRSAENAPPDTSEIQSNVIESWSMSFWGFKKGAAAMMVIVETPNDAAYQFHHPAGGPTVIGPRWRASLGRLAYPRAGRMCFFADGTYVTLAKRYRRHAMETGLFVSLREKIARTPRVASLIATPLTRLSILRNRKEDSQRYDLRDPTKNYSLTGFDERARQLREVKAKGHDRLHVCLTGWPRLGYDRQHPDELPPAPSAGGWEGMKRLAEACREMGYVLTLHEQFRDYYVDAPSYDPQFAIHEEDETSPPQAFPGTRFGTWKEGRIPFMRYWDGGKQTFLSPRFMLGHLRKNYEWLRERGVRPDGLYLDVFGYVPPDEDWNEEHPATRTDNLAERAACYNWTRQRFGIVGTEAACDWTVPYAAISSPLRPARGVPVPLFELVYHDAIITPYAPTDLRGLLAGGVPQASLEELEANMDRVRQMSALNERLALVEMTGHEFLDAGYRKERATFADGTTVTVDWDANTATVHP
jgi:hypothetical protein